MNQPGQPLAVCLYVQHLLGTGHLFRMRALARSLAAAGHEVTLLTGGRPVPGLTEPFDTVQLPSIRALPGDFTALRDATDRPVTADTWDERRTVIRETLAGRPPRVLVIETWPFGRRQFRHELEDLVATAREQSPRPVVMVSIRDILQHRSAKRQQETVEAVERWIDHVIVHADPTVVKLEESFPPAAAMADRMFYSGYVHSPDGNQPASAPGNDGEGEIIVSAGGGAVARELIETALAVHASGLYADLPWRILVGGGLDPDAAEGFRQQAGPGLFIESNRADFPRLLARCRLSVSQAGYNTALDVLRANCPSVMVPFASGGETEQTMRAEKLARLGRTVVVPEASLDAACLARAMERALDLAALPPLQVSMDGAERSARFIEQAGWRAAS